MPDTPQAAPSPSVEEARRNIYLDYTMSGDEDVFALIVAVRADERAKAYRDGQIAGQQEGGEIIAAMKRPTFSAEARAWLVGKIDRLRAQGRSGGWGENHALEVERYENILAALDGTP